MSSILTRLAPFSILLAIVAVAAAQNPKPRTAPLSIEEVLKLTKANVGEEVIVTRIKKNGKPFDLSADELLELRREGLNDTIIKYLMDPSLPYAPPPPPPPVVAPATAPPAPAKPPGPPPKKYPQDKYADKIPPEPGAYLAGDGDPVSIDLKMLVPTKSGGGILSAALKKKEKAGGLMVGPKAKTRLKNPVVVYIRLADPAKIEELTLIALAGQKDRREMELAVEGKKQKPAPKFESIRPFDAVEVGPKLFRVMPAKLAKGEYIFFLAGTADPDKGIQGKGYDFGVD